MTPDTGHLLHNKQIPGVDRPTAPDYFSPVFHLLSDFMFHWRCIFAFIQTDLKQNLLDHDNINNYLGFVCCKNKFNEMF